MASTYPKSAGSRGIEAASEGLTEPG